MNILMNEHKECIDEINRLKQEKNGVILVHNYQRPEIQDIGDFVGDSFGLAQSAAKTDADLIVFCGVDFMAETAKILSPQKTVIHPDIQAQCPMAAMVDVDSLESLKKQHQDAAVVAYVNTSAEVKAHTDICCTSSNAVKIIQILKEKEVIFIPDRNLGKYIERFITNKNIIVWPGICPTHHKIKKEDILDLKSCHPSAEIIVHPECNPDVIDSADAVYSTSGMVHHVAHSSKKEFIIGTEKELCYRLRKENPSKKIFEINRALCPNMKKITLEKVLQSLQQMQPKIQLKNEIIHKAKIPLHKMIEMGRGD